VGANLGYFTLLAAACLQNTGQVVAFEPGQSAFDCLTENISLNNFTNILPCPIAATNREGEAVLYSVRGLVDGQANLYRPRAGQTACEKITTVTLDSWRRQQVLAGPDFIKLDVEGAELAALTGAQEALGDNAPLLLVEMKEAIFQSLGTDRSAIQEFLNRWGYRPAWQGVAAPCVATSRRWSAATSSGCSRICSGTAKKPLGRSLGNSNQDGLKSSKEPSGAELTSGTLVSLVFVIS
jgi:FkbM family methyltransferase